ncbi:hypothetical protein CASFOL_004191 [Castilleja foliolosa]|uniref:Uncharacterized protein n=1 Tax=Castilleja foliolosa TaxID=1961234 RepID=A0ABD3EDH3_9LAMI
MAEVVVGPIIEVLLENLLKLSQEQIGLVRDFKNDMKKLQKTFAMVNDVLHDAQKRQVTDIAVKRWLRELEALAFDVDNVIDEFNYQLLAKKVGATKNKTVKKKVQSLFSSSNNNPIAYRLKLGRRIKDINERLKSINQQASDFGLQARIANAQAPVIGSDAIGSTETDSFTADPIFLGRENEVSKIMEKLIPTTPGTDEQVLSVLPIFGMGGLGKTTIAKKVFGDEKMISRFRDNRVFGEALLKKLEKHFRTKRYMLVLDDIWNEDREMWGDLVNSLTGISSATGNCMIVTSRSEVVASIVKTLPIHKLESLSEDDCWSIIKAKALKRLGDMSLDFETVGRNIAKTCQGLPLAAKVVGGLLFEKSKDEWLEIEKNWLSDFRVDKNPISKILKLSYDNLPSQSLKKCFAYCSVFPKGYEIEKQKLIELWMAEGFLQTEHQRNNINMETTGSKIFNLLWNSLLQVVRSDDYGNVTHCNMHDLVHDLSSSVVCENGLLQIRYIGYESSGDGLLSIPKGQEKNVRTLFFSGNVSDIKFSDFESLRTLTLVNEEGIDELPTSIRELKHLRYLDTLRAEKEFWDGYLEKLPDSLSCFINLSLYHTSMWASRRVVDSELGNLKDLKGGLEICNLEKVWDKNEAMSADLLGKTGINKLKLVWEVFREGDEANDESVLEGLS